MSQHEHEELSCFRKGTGNIHARFFFPFCYLNSTFYLLTQGIRVVITPLFRREFYWICCWVGSLELYPVRVSFDRQFICIFTVEVQWSSSAWHWQPIIWKDKKLNVILFFIVCAPFLLNFYCYIGGRATKSQSIHKNSAKRGNKKRSKEQKG